MSAPLFLTAALLLAAPSAAQTPPDVPVLPDKEVGPDDVRRAADWLKGKQGKGGQDLSQFPPKLVEYAKDLIRKNPGATKEDFEKKLLGGNPNTDPALAEALRKALEKGGGPSSPSPGGSWPVPEPGSGGPKGGSRTPSPKPMGPGPRPLEPDQQPATDGGRTGVLPQPDPNQPGQGRSDARGFRAGPPPPSVPNQPGDTDHARRVEQYKATERFLERNFGPLDQNSDLKNVLWEMFTGQDASDPNSALSGLFDGASDTGEGFFRSADSALPSDWKLPEFGKWDTGAPSAPSAPNYSPPSGGSFSGFGGGATSWLPVVILGAVAALALVLWWLWPLLTRTARGDPQPLPGLGPWPVDPRSIADREALVKAFEYLSILVCGGDARVWNHLTIAAELRRAVPDAADIADPLARLYAVARYTPAAEPLPPGAIANARRYLCRLAGVAA
jgi:hypothetical protein